MQFYEIVLLSFKVNILSLPSTQLIMETKNIFKELKNDLPASTVVFFVAVPLCLGIALNCEVVLKIEKYETKDNKLCDIRMIIPGNDLLAGARGNTFEEATMQTIEALERQIHKKETRTLQRGNKRAELK